MSGSSDSAEFLRLPVDRLQALLDQLTEQGFRTLGPVFVNAAVCIDEISRVEQLPRGVVDEQQPGVYRTQRTDAVNLFQFNLGADSWKRFFFPSRRLLYETDVDLIATSHPIQPAQPMALFGVRSCDLHALAIQQTVFDRVDDHYRRTLAEAFVIGVHCQTAASTCFCSSTGTGPEFPQSEFLDLLLTEITNDSGHFFIAQPHSERGRQLLSQLDLDCAEAHEIALIGTQLKHTRAQISRSLPGNVRGLLRDNLDAAQWDSVAERCLSCASCTLVCPTCFCSDIQDHTEINGDKAQRWQVWDSCFNQGHSYTHAGIVRETTRSRYRQWLTHKLSSWHDQFDTSGCTGCGRCITWCPVGIDLTAEVAAISAEAADEN